MSKAQDGLQLDSTSHQIPPPLLLLTTTTKKQFCLYFDKHDANQDYDYQILLLLSSEWDTIFHGKNFNPLFVTFSQFLKTTFAAKKKEKDLLFLFLELQIYFAVLPSVSEQICNQDESFTRGREKGFSKRN